MNEIQEIRFDKETSAKLDTLIECFQLVLEQIHVKNNTDIHRARKELYDESLPLLIKECVEEMKKEGIKVI